MNLELQIIDDITCDKYHQEILGHFDLILESDYKNLFKKTQSHCDKCGIKILLD